MVAGEHVGLIAEALEALRAAGFPLVGTAPVEHDGRDREAFSRFLGEGWQGPMEYLSRTAAHRLDVRRIFPWANGAVCAAMPYRTTREAPRGPAGARVSCYAWGRDYHKTLRKRLKAAEAVLQGAGHRARVCVDSVPLLERALCRRAGLGFIGKNGMLLHPDFGSYLFLGVVLTDLPVPAGREVPDGCGACQRCLDACPTGAFPGPRLLDGSRCLSTWTVEHHGSFPPATPRLEGHLFGCDLCQEVCPYNASAPLSAEPDFGPRPEWFPPDPEALLALDDAGLEHLLDGSPLRRAGHDGLRRNAARVLSENR